MIGNRGRRVAITGGTGFIGRRLVAAHLAAGDEVRLLTRRPAAAAPAGVLPHVVDLGRARPRDLDRFADDVDVLYHCAGELRDPARMEPLHVGGTAALLEAAVGRVRRWIQLSSVGVYGVCRSGVVTEESPLCPVGPYETTKARSDELVLERAARDGLEAVVVRPSTVIGTGMPSRWLWAMLAAVERGAFFFIGRPGASANYVPVDEVTSALHLAGSVHRTNASRVYNLSQWLTIEEFVGLLAHALEKPEPTRRLPERFVRAASALLGRIPGFPLTSGRVDALTCFARYPSERLAAELGYTPRRMIADAVADVATEWKRSRRDTCG